MRKNNIRRWLHCALDFLPLLLIPVFMVYSHRHTLTERTEVDVQYKYQSNEVNSRADIVRGNIYFTEMLTVGDDCSAFSLVLLQYDYASLTVGSFEDYATSEFTNNESALWVKFDSTVRPYGIRYYFTNLNTYVKTFDDQEVYANFDNVIFYIPTDTDDTTFNLTLSLFDDDYGFGNTMPQYTDYNVIESVDFVDTQSDIMSVFTEDFYNATHTYFNMDNVGNLGGMYNWVETNMFHGNVPLGIHAVWHIITYEFVMDIIFLIYSVFMFIIDFTEKFLTSMYDKSFGGGK